MHKRRLALLCILPMFSIASGSRADAPVLAGAEAARTAAPAVFRPLPFFYDLYTFRGAGDSTAVVTAYAVDAGRLETASMRGGARYRFSVSLVLADTARRVVSGSHDTVFVDVDRRLPGGHLLYTKVEVLAAPSSTTQQRVIMIDATAPGIGQLYTDSLPIPDYSGTNLMISDVALGQPGAEHGWRRGGATLALLPTSRFPTSAFDVYYEIYNLPAGRPYTTEISIARTDASAAAAVERREPVRLRFSGESAAAPDGMLPELRRVETSLARGSYQLTVRITDLATGAAASRSRAFTVRGGDRGATMVAALPHRSGYLPDRW